MIYSSKVYIIIEHYTGLPGRYAICSVHVTHQEGGNHNPEYKQAKEYAQKASAVTGRLYEVHVLGSESLNTFQLGLLNSKTLLIRYLNGKPTITEQTKDRSKETD